MAQSQAQTMIQDSRGFIWVGTWGGGISKFDGKNFQTINTESGFFSNFILAIYEDLDGNIWFGSSDNGICKYDGRTYKVFTEKDGFNAVRINCITGDHLGRIWVGTYNAGLFAIEHSGRILEFTQKDGLSSNMVRCVFQDGNGNILIGTEGGIDRFNGSRFEDYSAEKGLPHSICNVIQQDFRGNLWFGMPGVELVKFDGHKATIYGPKDGLAPSNIRALTLSRSGDLWIVGFGGVSVWNGLKFRSFYPENGFGDTHLFYSMEDSEGNIWLCSSGKGIFKYVGDRFVHYGEMEGLQNTVVWTINRLDANRIMVTTNDGISILENGRFTEWKLPNEPYYAAIRKAIVCKNGSLLISGGNAVFFWDKGKITKLEWEDGSKHNRLRDVFQTRDGICYVIDDDKVARVVGDKLVSIFKDATFEDSRPMELAEDSLGRLWITTLAKGVFVWDGKRLTQFNSSNGLLSDKTMSVQFDPKGNAWIATYAGISKYDGKDFCYITKREGLNSNSIYILKDDGLNNYWVGTERGLNKVVLDDDFNPVRIQNYGDSDGFRDIECNQSAVLKDSSGVMWFGTIGGVTCYDPSKDVFHVYPLPVYITDMLLFYEPTDWSGFSDTTLAWTGLPLNAQLPYSKNHVSLHFSAINTTTPTKVKYSFRLNGLDSKWSPPTDKTEAVYASLPPGEYTFEVIAIHDDGSRSQTPASVSFTILSPIWLKWWFFAFSALGLILLGVVFMNIRTRRIIRQRQKLELLVDLRTTELKAEKEKVEEATRKKSEFLATMSHEIRTPLNGVIGMTDLLMETPLNSEQQKFTQTIRSSGENLLALINDILDISRLESGKLDLESRPFNLNHCIEQAIDISISGHWEKDVEVCYEIGPKVSPTIIGDIVRLRQILINLLNNALKFTEKGEIHLKVKNHSQQGNTAMLEFSLRDTGIGIPAEKQDNLFKAFSQVDSSTARKFGGTGLGLAICATLTEKMGGEIWVESEVGKGTTFSFQIQVDIPEVVTPFPKPEERAMLLGKRIMVLAPNTTQRNSVLHTLAQWGMQPQGFDTPESLRFELGKSERPDIILVTYEQSNAEGLISQLQSLHKKGTHILIQCRAPRLKEVIEKAGATQWAFSGVIAKPLRATQMLETLQIILSGKSLDYGSKSGITEDDKNAALKLDKVLIVEDNPVNTEVLRRLLQRLGIESDSAENGLLALKALEKRSYPIVFMDVEMPEMDGYTATGKIIERWQNNRPVIIAMTANAMTGDREKCLNAGMDDYVSKPVSLDVLREAIFRWIKPEMAEKNVSQLNTQQINPVVSQQDEVILETMNETGQRPPVNLDKLLEISGGDKGFVVALLSQMTGTLPVAFENMKTHLDAQDYPGLKAAAHKTKSTFAYLGMEDMRELFKQIEYSARDESDLDTLPDKIHMAITVGEEIVAELKEKITELMA